MIKEIEWDQLHDIDPLINRFREVLGESAFPENFSDQIRDSVSNKRASLFGDFADDGSLRGLGLFGKISSRISFVFADGNFEIEKGIVNTLFDRFSSERSYIVTGGPWLTDSLVQLIIELGFVKHDRAYMTLARADVENLSEPVLPEAMSFETYTENNREEISDLVFRCTDGHVDQDVFPEYFGTPETCVKLLENIESNRYGDYTEGLSWILRHDDKDIGACFMTCRNGDTGYIPDIVIEHEYRGQGLGKAILVHSMKRQLESESAITKVDLDVTLNNNARFLYKSLGFKDVREYTTYTWKK
ncbi:MAG: GNAT family N-acetyltransferase [Candidatus Thorarchaeota archaeon]